MASEKLKAFTIDCRLGPVFGAVSSQGLMCLSLPEKDQNYFLGQVERLSPGAQLQWVDPAQTHAGAELLEYFQARRTEFEAPPDLRCVTDFTRAVLDQLPGIPCGQTLTYGQVAAKVGRPKASRAVGRAVGSNPIPVLIPCHRVIGAGGRLTGFASGLDMKRALLALETQKTPLV